LLLPSFVVSARLFFTSVVVETEKREKEKGRTAR
jgi:hypothetical protein